MTCAGWRERCSGHGTSCRSAFLELRFGPHYRHFADPGLDPARPAFYRLATCLSLVAGPLRLLDGDFPDRAGMLDIVDQNVSRTLDRLPG